MDFGKKKKERGGWVEEHGDEEGRTSY